MKRFFIGLALLAVCGIAFSAAGMMGVGQMMGSTPLSNVPPPPSGSILTTEAGDYLVTEAGNNLVTE